MTILLSLAAAVSWGASDFLGGLAGRRLGVELSSTIAFASQLIGLAGLGTAALILGGELSAADAWLGVGAGVSGSMGVLFLFRGLALGRMGIVAPVTGALAAAIPAAVSPAVGEPPGPLAWLGIVIALAAIAVVARAPDPDGVVAGRTLPPGLPQAILAGIGFAGGGIFLNGTSEASELLVFLPMKGVATLLLAVIVWRRRERPTEARSHWRLLLATGVLDNLANIFFLFALRGGILAVVAVLAGLYPVGTTLLARIVLHERLAQLQQAGFALAIAAVVIIGLA